MTEWVEVPTSAFPTHKIGNSYHIEIPRDLECRFRVGEMGQTILEVRLRSLPENCEKCGRIIYVVEECWVGGEKLSKKPVRDVTFKESVDGVLCVECVRNTEGPSLSATVAALSRVIWDETDAEVETAENEDGTYTHEISFPDPFPDPADDLDER